MFHLFSLRPFFMKVFYTLVVSIVSTGINDVSIGDMFKLEHEPVLHLVSSGMEPALYDQE